jgi:hypothetical protein
MFSFIEMYCACSLWKCAVLFLPEKIKSHPSYLKLKAGKGAKQLQRKAPLNYDQD